MIDAKKLEDYLAKELVAASRAAHNVPKGSFDRIKLVSEMDILTKLIKYTRLGKFTYEYEVLEGALDDFESFINGTE